MSRCLVPVIGFVAASGSGKTTILKKLLPVLEGHGLRVGYLKHAHHTFDLDIPGKDSFEIREAGAVQTLLASSERWALQSEKRDKGTDPSLDEMLSRFDAHLLDLILVEGFKYAAFAKIELHRAAVGEKLLYPEDPDIVAVVTDVDLPDGDHPLALPIGDLEAIAGFILGFMGSDACRSRHLKRDLVRYYRWLRLYGLNDSHSGNASVRGGEGFWVTPTGACADSLGSEDLVQCPWEGPCPEGASLDSPLHGLVYQRQPRAVAVLRSHGPYSVAMSFAGQDYRPADSAGRYFLETVPVLSVAYEDYREQVPQVVSQALAEHPIVMVRGHGVYAWGEDLDLAYKWTCALELSAKTYVIARQAAAF